MWVHSKVLIAERAEHQATQRALASAETLVEWLKLRVNQLEKERAILFREVTQLPIPVPEIVATPLPTSADHILNKQAASDLWAGCDDGTIKN